VAPDRGASRAGHPSLCLIALVVLAGLPEPARAQSEDLPVYLRDRGPGMPTSMFGSYIRRGELLIYPFYEYYFDKNFEYKPSELGYGLEDDFRGEYTAHEGILFVGYGVNDWLALELEAAIITARLETSAADPASPPVIEESGGGDVEGQIRARLMKETEKRPELFVYFEAVSPQQKTKPLVGTPDWELKYGAGVVRGFRWGTVTARASGEHLLEDSTTEFGEYAVEYLKRLSPEWRVYAGLEGAQDELSLIAEGQWHFSPSAYLKLNGGFGLTSKALDFTPEVGVMFSIPTAR